MNSKMYFTISLMMS